ncbi:PAAR domain-containing protein [Massilia oculi]|uniref:PAAR domain-containing protein n=1 Tax=Massilia oculi TaxID=945844 RepID=UPI001AAEF111|nr:PAAR domain-containing protein [Massilia oculi]
MKIIGWIREGDTAACGGVVTEGDWLCRGRGRAYAFQGAQMACKKKCLIADGFSRRTLTNGRASVIHGMVTSGGCPLLSTLNDLDGVSNGGGRVPTSFFLNADGHWTGDAPALDEHPYDEQVLLRHQRAEGLPYLIETMDGRVFSGRIGPDGLLPRVDTFGEDEYSVLWGDDALAKMQKEPEHG